jgi:hypothetical protein
MINYTIGCLYSQWHVVPCPNIIGKMLRILPRIAQGENNAKQITNQ